MEQEKLYEKLLNVLLEEKAFFSRMLKLSEKKTDVIMHNRVKELEQIVSEEQSIFASLDEKEKTREALTKTLAQRLGPGLHEIHIQEIIDRMPSSYRSKFIPLVQELRMILRKQKPLAWLYRRQYEKVREAQSVNNPHPPKPCRRMR
jgi:hypothetical protein